MFRKPVAYSAPAPAKLVHSKPGLNIGAILAWLVILAVVIGAAWRGYLLSQTPAGREQIQREANGENLPFPAR